MKAQPTSVSGCRSFPARRSSLWPAGAWCSAFAREWRLASRGCGQQLAVSCDQGMRYCFVDARRPARAAAATRTHVQTPWPALRSTTGCELVASGALDAALDWAARREAQAAHLLVRAQPPLASHSHFVGLQAGGGTCTASAIACSERCLLIDACVAAGNARRVSPGTSPSHAVASADQRCCAWR